jgi:hypothetical protein
VAYPHNALQDPALLKDVQLRLLNQLTDETVLIERAKALHIGISDAEIENVIEKIKADYPEGTFQQTLFEAAIPYPLWVQRMKTRLLIDRVIEKDLAEKVEITPDDVSSFLRDREKIDDSLIYDDLENLDETAIARLRRKKAEETYHEWMKSLKQTYRVEINQDLWSKIVKNP